MLKSKDFVPCSLTMNVTVRKWVLIPYVKMLLLFARLTGLQPDSVKVSEFINKYCIKITSK